KASLVLVPVDKIALFALTVAISHLSWRFVEQPFRDRTLAPTRRDAFRLAAASSALLVVGSIGGGLLSVAPTETDRAAAQLDAYNAYDYRPFYRSGSCFAPESGTFEESCLDLAADKTNVLLWGDSLAAHYFYGLSRNAGPQGLNILQATMPACMPTFNAAAQ